MNACEGAGLPLSSTPMPARILEAVPNFSEGRDRAVVEDVVAAVESAGAEVLDWSLDPDHHRSVVTFVGPPATVEAAAVAAAAVARDRIDLRRHRGVHPRIGATDVLPIVPVAGATMADARDVARRIGGRLAGELGIPVYFYGAASEPPGRGLAELRRGGFETLAVGWPEGRAPDVLPGGWAHAGAHPTAGATCVGARHVLLAWNVWIDGVSLEDAAEVARSIRERNGGFRGLRALALRLEARAAMQISMNLEDPGAVSPMDVFRVIEERIGAAGGRIVRTEVIGMMPDPLVLSAAADRLRLDDASSRRLLSTRLAEYLAGASGAPPVME